MKSPHGSKGKTREEHTQETRTKLLDAAENLYAERGPDNLTVRAIADRAGTTAQPIYSFFGGLDALTGAMYDRAIGEVERIIGSSEEHSLAVDGADVQGQRVSLWSVAAENYRRYCRQYPGRFRMLVTAGEGIGVPEAAELQSKLLVWLTELSMPASEEPSGVLNSRLRLSLSCIHGFIQAESTGFVPESDADRLFAELVERLSVSASELAKLTDADARSDAQ